MILILFLLYLLSILSDLHVIKCIVGRGFLTSPYFMKTLPILPTCTLPFFRFCPTPLPYCLQPPPSLLILWSCFFGWMGDLAAFDVLFYLMISWMYTCWAWGPWCFFYGTRCQVYWVLTHDVLFCWYLDLITHQRFI